jgi:hypothetical protein
MMRWIRFVVVVAVGFLVGLNQFDPEPVQDGFSDLD